MSRSLTVSLLAILFLAAITLGAEKKKSELKPKSTPTPKSDAYLEIFYWNPPPGGIWYDSIAKLAPQLASAGYSAVWFPPPEKGASGAGSMGYDPYDHYDFGDYNQNGTIETRFGNSTSLKNSISAFHAQGISVFMDAVMTQMDGGEQTQHWACTPSGGFPSGWGPDSALLSFKYANGSGRFPLDSSDFYPNAVHCGLTQPYEYSGNPAYQFGYWLDREQQAVADSFTVWGQYLVNNFGVDGFRIDDGKAAPPSFLGYFLQNANSGQYAVSENQTDDATLVSWVNQVATDGGTVSAFDFDLRGNLYNMCNNTSGSFWMTNLDGAGLIHNGLGGYNISTFVENHDTDPIGYDGTGSGGSPIVTDKMLAYAFIMFAEGRPCIFFKDYYTYHLGPQIDSLNYIRMNFLGGSTTYRSSLNPYYIGQNNFSTDQTTLSHNVYVARREGNGSQPGGYLVINNNSSDYVDVYVDVDETKYPVGTPFKDYTNHDVIKYVVGPTGGDTHNRIDLYAPKRGYTIYVPDTSDQVSYPPVIASIPMLSTYTNANFTYQTEASVGGGESLTYSLSNAPAWLHVNQSGLLYGMSSFADTGLHTGIVTVQNSTGGTAADTFSVQVTLNHAPKLMAIRDTTIKATKRYQFTATATDTDGDPIAFSFTSSPGWLNIGSSSGILSGTPDVTDTGAFPLKLYVTDGKGGYDSASFTITVKPNTDTLVATYAKPTIDGTVNIGSNDWSQSWEIKSDSLNDSKWWTNDSTPNNQLYGIFATWDADSLYLGIAYLCTDVNNTMMLYIDAGISGGVTDFNSTQGYKGDYPKNNLFPAQTGIDYFVADYYDAVAPSMFRTVAGDTDINITPLIHGVRGHNGHDAEIAISWNDIYGLGAGLIPPHVQLKLVAVIAGGTNYGCGDACPSSPTVNGTAGPDSLINFATISPDTNGDGIPDPTVYIDSSLSIASYADTSVPGWQIISIPYLLSNSLQTAIFPGTLTPAYNFDTAYHTTDTLKNALGYWLKFDSTRHFTITGTVRTRDTISVRAGWNLIGTLSKTEQTSTVVQIPSGIISSDYYTYAGKQYVKSTTLTPGKGYWIKVSENGKLVLVSP